MAAPPRRRGRASGRPRRPRSASICHRRALSQDEPALQGRRGRREERTRGAWGYSSVPKSLFVATRPAPPRNPRPSPRSLRSFRLSPSGWNPTGIPGIPPASIESLPLPAVLLWCTIGQKKFRLYDKASPYISGGARPLHSPYSDLWGLACGAMELAC